MGRSWVPGVVGGWLWYGGGSNRQIWCVVGAVMVSDDVCRGTVMGRTEVSGVVGTVCGVE